MPDRQLQAQALRYVQDGQAFTFYFGHSSAEGLYGGGAHYLDRDDWAELKIPRGQGIFGTFGCNGCQLSGKAFERRFGGKVSAHSVDTRRRRRGRRTEKDAIQRGAIKAGRGSQEHLA